VIFFLVLLLDQGGCDYLWFPLGKGVELFGFGGKNIGP